MFMLSGCILIIFHELSIVGSKERVESVQKVGHFSFQGKRLDDLLIDQNDNPLIIYILDFLFQTKLAQNHRFQLL